MLQAALGNFLLLKQYVSIENNKYKLNHSMGVKLNHGEGSLDSYHAISVALGSSLKPMELLLSKYAQGWTAYLIEINGTDF